MENEIQLVVKMEELRQKMNELIVKQGNLLDSRVIKISQDLDKILNEYNRLEYC